MRRLPNRPINPKGAAMLDEEVRVVVEDGSCTLCAVPTKLVHHRDFPEIQAECGSVAEGAAYLAGRLSLDREGVASAWHRELIDHAIADVAAFLDALAERPQDIPSACRCTARIAGPVGPRSPEHRTPESQGDPSVPPRI
jgi:hypothetical protein